jgi:hypothetical protein
LNTSTVNGTFLALGIAHLFDFLHELVFWKQMHYSQSYNISREKPADWILLAHLVTSPNFKSIADIRQITIKISATHYRIRKKLIAICQCLVDFFSE